MDIEDQIVCFGEVLWDVFPKEQKPGGAPLNVAVHLTNFGFTPSLVSRIGRDQPGEDLIRFISNKGVDCQHIQYDNVHPTGVVNVHVETSGNATYDIVFPSAWDYTKYEEDLEAGYHLIFGSLGSRNQNARETLFKLLEKAGKAIFDVNFRAPHFTQNLIEQLLLKSDIVKLNDEEIQIISSWYDQQQVSLEAQCSFLTERFTLDQIIVTLGSKGAAIFQNGKFVRHRGYQVKVQDTVGSGDAFLASYIANFFHGATIEESLDLACATGALVATKVGAVPEYQMSDINKIRSNH